MAGAAPWPTGTVALVFTDLERSTELWQIDEEAFGQALILHDQVVRQVLAAQGGIEVKHTGDGFFLVFAEVGAAASFALDLQTLISQQEWPGELGDVRTRIGIHWGRARLHGTDYRGSAVNLASRVCNASSGGQILVSGETAEALQTYPGLGTRLKSMGSYHLPGLAAAVDVFELQCEATREFDFRPLSAEGRAPATGEGADVSFNDDDDERWQRVKLALRQADNATAIQELSVLHEHHPMDVRVLTTLGVAYAVEQQYEQSEQCLSLAVDLEPSHAAAWFNLARVFGKMGRRDQIGHALAMALRADPNHPKARSVATKYGVVIPEV